MADELNQFIVKKLREPTDKQLEGDIEWICHSLGFVTPRDQDKTAFRILKALVKSAKEGNGLTSEELAEEVEPTIGSVIYHLKRLMKSGLVVKMNSTYQLKMQSLMSTINGMQKEVNMVMEDIKRVAQDVDDKVGLEHRQ